MLLFQLGFLSVTMLCLYINPVSAEDGRCTTTVYRLESRIQFEKIRIVYTTSCGFWGLRRCRRVRYQSVYRWVYLTKEVVQSQCCRGYQPTANNSCAAICDNCDSLRYCKAPNECDCNKTGFTGPNCNTPLCSNNCSSHQVCTAPDTCGCPQGYTGQSCAEDESLTDIDECAQDHACEQLCINQQGSYSCNCNANFILAEDSMSCIGKVSISLSTVNSSTLVIVTYPVWDTERKTISYNITCSRYESNTTMSSSHVISAMEGDTKLSLNASGGYTCCAAAVTQYGVGPPSCSQPISVTTVEMQGRDERSQGVVHSKAFKIGLPFAIATVSLFFFIIAMLVLFCIMFRKRRNKKTSGSNQASPSVIDLGDEREFTNGIYEMHETGIDSACRHSNNIYEMLETDARRKLDFRNDEDHLVYNNMYPRTAVDNACDTGVESTYHYIQ